MCPYGWAMQKKWTVQFSIHTVYQRQWGTQFTGTCLIQTPRCYGKFLPHGKWTSHMWIHAFSTLHLTSLHFCWLMSLTMNFKRTKDCFRVYWIASLLHVSLIPNFNLPGSFGRYSKNNFPIQRWNIFKWNNLNNDIIALSYVNLWALFQKIEMQCSMWN